MLTFGYTWPVEKRPSLNAHKSGIPAAVSETVTQHCQIIRRIASSFAAFYMMDV
jgi:hypothetical protein